MFLLFKNHLRYDLFIYIGQIIKNKKIYFNLKISRHVSNTHSVTTTRYNRTKVSLKYIIIIFKVIKKLLKNFIDSYQMFKTYLYTSIYGIQENSFFQSGRLYWTSMVLDVKRNILNK